MIPHKRSRIAGEIDLLNRGVHCWSLEFSSKGRATIGYTTMPSTFTVWTWVKTNYIAVNAYIINKVSYYALNENDFPFSLNLRNDLKILAQLDAGGNWDADIALTSDNAIMTNKWYFIAAKYSSPTLTIYINDVKKTASNAITPSANGENWTLGIPATENAGGLGEARFSGRMWGFGLYSTAKTDDEIEAIRKGYLDTTNASVLYDFSEGTSTALTDLSGNSRNATLSGVAWVLDSPWQPR